MTVMPAEITYGYVADRLILAVGDGTDGNRTPDARPAVGKIKFTPKTKVMPVSAPTPGRVLPQAIEASLDADGYLIDDQGAQGVWLVAGRYDVTYSFTFAKVAGHEIEVTAAHTEAEPLYLTLAAPPGGPILNRSQYTELNNRLLVVEAGGGGTPQTLTLTGSDLTLSDGGGTVTLPSGGGGAVDSVNGQTGTVSLDAADVGAATAAQGALAGTAVQPEDLDPYATDADLTAGLSGKADADHAHTVTDLTTTGTADATTVLHGDGSWKPVASGDPGADGADGASAYEVAVANGFVGTEAEWLASLSGSAEHVALAISDHAKADEPHDAYDRDMVNLTAVFDNTLA